MGPAQQQVKCPSCGGNRRCTTCGGTGNAGPPDPRTGDLRSLDRCRSCKGTGHCPTCLGSGWVTPAEAKKLRTKLWNLGAE
jgi:DnaJ-class molecular chaperone